MNPYDRDEVAGALNQALTMSLAERISRHAEMLETIIKNDIDNWQARFICDLRKVTSRQSKRQLSDSVPSCSKLA